MNENDITVLRSHLHELCFAVEAFIEEGRSIERRSIERLVAIADAEAKFSAALHDLWPSFRQGRVGPPGSKVPPLVQRRSVKLTLTLEDLGL